MQYLHATVHGAEGVGFFVKVFCETGCVALVSEGFLMPIVLHDEASTSLSDIRLIAVGTG